MKSAIGRLALRLSGWKIAGELPDTPKYVLIAAPHTSNWDLYYMLAIAFALRMKINWMGKDTLFRAPFGFILRWLGGVPIDRSKTNNIVAAMADEFSKHERLILAVPPAGTRGHRDYWKSGFYHIARIAQVPIVMGYLDYATKRGGFGGALTPGDDIAADMDRMRAFYGTVSGKFPDNESTVRLRDEGASGSSAADDA